MFSPARGRSLGARAETEGGLAHYFKGHAVDFHWGQLLVIRTLLNAKEFQKQTGYAKLSYFKGNAKLLFQGSC